MPRTVNFVSCPIRLKKSPIIKPLERWTAGHILHSWFAHARDNGPTVLAILHSFNLQYTDDDDDDGDHVRLFCFTFL